MRATFRLQTYNLCAIVDEDREGQRSVTNDIEDVLASLVACDALHPENPYQRVIYRDSDGRWDQVVIDEGCRFVEFAPIREWGVSVAQAPDADPRELLARILLDEVARERGQRP